MPGQLSGKVVFITGAARGQGRSHAVRFAEEGADVIAVDLCQAVESVDYPMATQEDLEETARLVKQTGARIVAEQGDVRDFDRLQEIVDVGVGQLGRIDFVLANAGIAPISEEQTFAAYRDAIDIMLNGVFYTIEAALPSMLAHGDGGAIIITSSIAGLTGSHARFSMKSPGGAGYAASKHGVVGLMRFYANALAEKNIRVNTVHPTGVATPMVMNEQVANYAQQHPEFAAATANLMPVPIVEPSDVSDAMIYLCGQSGRYLTGVTLPIDAGYVVG